MRLKSKLIVFEGVEGAGKSTQIALLRDYLINKGCSVRMLREPGGTPVSESIRSIFKNPDHIVCPESELFLISAARSQLIREVIEKEESDYILLDRYTLSTMAYQFHGHGLPYNQVEMCNQIATKNITPDMCFVLSIPFEESLARIKSRGGEDRMERLGEAFLKRVFDGYQQMSYYYYPDCLMIDGNLPVEKVHETITGEVDVL